MSEKTQKPLNVIAHELLTGHECRLHITHEAYRGPVPAWWEVIPDGIWKRVPQYDTDIAAAWRLVEAMQACPYCTVKTESSHYHGTRCIVSAAHHSQRCPVDLVKRDANSATLRPESVQSMPLAITTAFIEACKPEESQ